MREQCKNIAISMDNIKVTKDGIVSSISNVGAISEEVTANAQTTSELNLKNTEDISSLKKDVKELSMLIQGVNQ